MAFPVLRCNLVPSCFEGVEFSSVIVGGWQLSCVFEKLDRLPASCVCVQDGDVVRWASGGLSDPVASAALSPCGTGKVELYRQLGPPSVQGLAFASGCNLTV